MKNNFTNTGRLVRFILRRERISSSLWIILLSLFSIALAPMLASMFDAPARDALILTIDNPAMIGMLGPIYGMDNYTEGAMYFNMMVQWVMLTAAVMNILLVVRHTRTDEEQGRMDMLKALPSGRLSGLCAVMLTAAIVDLLVTLITGFGITVTGTATMNLNGSLLYGAALGAASLVFGGIAAICAQICASSRGAIGLSIIILGFFYLLRGAGDIGNEMLAYISPLGLAQRTQAYVENNWWPIILLLIEAVVLFCIAFALNSLRDIRQGLLPQRRGRETARRYLCSPYGLAFRLLAMPFWGWIIGMYIIGASYGSILGTIDTFVQSSEFYSMVIGASPDYSTAQMFVSMVNSIMALCAVVPVFVTILKLRSEEKDGYYLNVLSRSVSRRTYITSYVVVSFITSILAQCATALGIYSAAIAVLPDPDTLPLDDLFKANLVYLPALWVMLGLAVLLIGLLPRMTTLLWIYFGFSFFATFMGRLPDLLPEWVQKLTPFGYIPNLPADDIEWSTLLILTGVAMGMIAIGTLAYQKRDIITA